MIRDNLDNFVRDAFLYLIYVYDYEFCVELAFIDKYSQSEISVMDFLRYNCDYNYSPKKNTGQARVIYD